VKVLLVNTQLEAGGAQRVALDIASALRGRGIHTQSLFLYAKHPAYEDEPHVITLARSRPRSPWAFLHLAHMLISHVRAERPDAVIAFTHYANILALAAARLAGVDARIASHQNPLDSYPRIARPVDMLMGATGWYTRIVAVSHATAASASAYPVAYRRKLVVVPNGTRLVSATVDVRSRYELPERFVLAVGRLAEQKNHALLLRALPAVPGVHLVIAGEGPLRSQLEQLAVSLDIRSRVHFLGNVASDDVSGLMSVADVFVMPSRFEGLSLALIEALALGLAVISSDIPSQREVLIDDSGTASAVLLPPDNPEAWSDALRSLIGDSSTRAVLGERARLRARYFSIESTASGYLDAIGLPHTGN